MSEPVYMQVPVQECPDQEMGVLLACIFMIEKNPRAGFSRELTGQEKERIANYLAARYAMNGEAK